MRLALRLATALLAATPALAHAGTITQTSVITTQNENDNGLNFAAFNAFNTSLGTLNSVSSTLTVNGTSSAR